MNALIPKLYDLGIRTRQDKKLTLNGLSTLLHNPFYAGLIQVKTRGELFPGAHQPLVTKKLFERVQDILAGKTVEKRLRHTMLFRKLIRCSHCGSTLIGEKQKGNVYYRCHIKGCPQKTIREDIVEEQFVLVLQSIRFSECENRYLRQRIKEQHYDYLRLKETQQQALRLQLDQLQARLAKLTDALIDGLIEKEAYLQRKNRLVLEEQGIKEQFKTLDDNQDRATKRIERFLELANSAYTSYKLASYDEKRELVKIITSNSTINDKSLLFKLNLPFQILFERQKIRCGSPERSEDRTLLALLSQLTEYFKDHELLSSEPKVQ
jgi:site-specific DNA recombinase